MTTLTIYLQDEAPRIGCGWRTVELVSKGYKWVKIRARGGQCVKLRRSVWDAIERSKRDDNTHRRANR